MKDQARLQAELQKLMKKASDDGRLIEVGWLSLRAASVPHDAPQLQLEEMRQSFFAGAAHLFSSIMTILDPGSEPTDADMRRLDMINSELDAFITLYAAKHGLPVTEVTRGRS